MLSWRFRPPGTTSSGRAPVYKAQSGGEVEENTINGHREGRKETEGFGVSKRRCLIGAIRGGN